MGTPPKEVRILFERMMERCRLERKAKGRYSVRELSKFLGKTENYISSIENGREIPSLKTFLHYLLVNGFDVEPLTKLEVREAANEESETRAALIRQIYDLNSSQLEFLAEQTKLAEKYRVKKRS